MQMSKDRVFHFHHTEKPIGFNCNTNCLTMNRIPEANETYLRTQTLK